MKEKLILLIMHLASVNHINPILAVSVADYESSFNVYARGASGEMGLFQVMPANFPDVDRAFMFTPIVNVSLGITLLKEAKRICPHKEEYEWVVCYNLGYEKAKKIRHPRLWPYYKEIKMRMLKYQKEEIIKIHKENYQGNAIYLEKSFKNSKKHIVLINRLAVEVDETEIKQKAA